MFCEICNTTNSKFAVKCKTCGAFLQNPVRVLSLFETLEMLILNPREGFHKIILSERKNFSVPLALFFGIATTFDLFYFVKVGEKLNNLAMLIFYITLFGSLSGVILAIAISLVVKFFLLFSKEKISFKSVFAVFTYSMFPIAFSIFFLLPIILGVFGIYYFTESPKPRNLKSFPFYILFFANFSLKLYSFALLNIAFKYITDNPLKGYIFAFLALICILVLLNLLTEALEIIL